jgi:maleate cis-trans isomerase
MSKNFLSKLEALTAFIFTEGIVETLERDLQVPVIHANVAQAWEIMKRLRVHEPKQGLGTLLRELPPMIE